jgi:acetyltransferase-like isoleucine patch superfamily enzyme
MIIFLKSIIRFFLAPIRTSILIFKLKKKHKTLKLSGQISVKNSKFGEYNYLENTTFNNSSLDDFSYVGSQTHINNTTIGKFTCIGPNVKIGLGEHPTNTFVSIHPVFYSNSKQIGFSFVNKNYFKEFNETIIGHDVWIGSNVVVKGGVNIGHGAIIASGAVVTKDVLPYMIVGGVPAKVIKTRFQNEIIKDLLNLEWWNKDLEWLRENSNKFHNVKNFFND